MKFVNTPLIFSFFRSWMFMIPSLSLGGVTPFFIQFTFMVPTFSVWVNVGYNVQKLISPPPPLPPPPLLVSQYIFVR